MDYCLASLSLSGALTTEERRMALSEMERHHDRFHIAMDTIRQNARFTPAGAAIFDGAIEYMKKKTDLLQA
jgi:hypothetical protein